MWSQKPPETILEVINFKIFLGGGVPPDPLRYCTLEFPPSTKNSCINPWCDYPTGILIQEAFNTKFPEDNSNYDVHCSYMYRLCQIMPSCNLYYAWTKLNFVFDIKFRHTILCHVVIPSTHPASIFEPLSGGVIVGSEDKAQIKPALFMISFGEGHLDLRTADKVMQTLLAKDAGESNLPSPATIISEKNYIIVWEIAS
jgi:hypothetical protein